MERTKSRAAQAAEYRRAAERYAHNYNRQDSYRLTFQSCLKHSRKARTGPMTLDQKDQDVKVHQFRDNSILIIPQKGRPFVATTSNAKQEGSWEAPLQMRDPRPQPEESRDTSPRQEHDGQSPSEHPISTNVQPSVKETPDE